MRFRQLREFDGLLRRISPSAVVVVFALIMTASVLGVVAWKALDARKTALARGQTDTLNIAHSLAEHATHAIQSADIAMGGMAELLRYREPPQERFNRYLADTVSALPQLREIGVLDANGKWLYSSLPQALLHHNSDRPYFSYHRETPGNALRINEPLQSRQTGRSTIILSKRIDRQDGSFAGVLTAAIDSDYFDQFYRMFQLGPAGSISLLRDDGVVLIRWPLSEKNTSLASPELFFTRLKQSPAGYYKITSPIDGTEKYIGHEKTRHFHMAVAVAISEEWLLSDWRKTLRTDAIVSAVLLLIILLLAAVLFTQFRFRMRTERALREREAHYRLLTDNIADIIILIDTRGILHFVSQSVEPVLGLRAQDLIGTSCFDLVHPDDVAAVQAASARLGEPGAVSIVVFRIARADGSLAWVEVNFKLAPNYDGTARTGFVGVLRDVTERKRMEDELNLLNRRLTQLAATDGLTGLTNRRTFDGFLRREYEACERISVLLFDIDNFKGYNDTYGHQAGDRCLQAVAKVIGDATSGMPGLSARYGGEEFAVVLPNMTEDAALKVAESIRLTVRALGIPNTASSRGCVTISAGVATRTAATLDESVLVGDADTALYEAKRLGRNRCVACSALDLHYVEAASIQPDAHGTERQQSPPRARIDLAGK